MLLKVRTLRKGGNRITIRPSRGAQGTSGEIHIGEVVSVPHGEPAEVVNTGTPTEAVLNFKLPVGAKGKDFTTEDIDLLETEIKAKVDKVEGKQLSDNNYSSAEKTKLAGIEAGAQVNDVSRSDVDGKADADHTHLSTDITDLNTTIVESITNSTQTFTNKRINSRVASTASGSTLTPTIASFDQYAYTALSEDLTINAPTGTPVDGNKLIFRIKDNGTARTLTWSAIYREIGTTLPSTTTIDKVAYVGVVYNAAETLWDVIAVAKEV